MHNLAGKTFGYLTVIRRAAIHRKDRAYWFCVCQCKKETVVSTDKLLSGHTKSCGCYQKNNPRITHGETRGHRSTWSARTKMLYAAKARAKKIGIPFTIVLEDIVVPDVCPILGIPIVKNSNQCQPNSPSLDRIIPSKGYTKNNIQVISHKANTIKSNATVEELRKVLEYMESK